MPRLARAFSMIAAALPALMTALPAQATTAIPLPEPGTWGLVGVGAVAAAIVTIRNRRK